MQGNVTVWACHHFQFCGQFEWHFLPVCHAACVAKDCATKGWAVGSGVWHEARSHQGGPSSSSGGLEKQRLCVSARRLRRFRFLCINFNERARFPAFNSTDSAGRPIKTLSMRDKKINNIFKNKKTTVSGKGNPWLCPVSLTLTFAQRAQSHGYVGHKLAQPVLGHGWKQKKSQGIGQMVAAFTGFPNREIRARGVQVRQTDRQVEYLSDTFIIQVLHISRKSAYLRRNINSNI